MATDHIQDHIDLIARHEQEHLAKRSFFDRVGDSVATFAGSFAFVVIHLAAFILWISVNSFRIPHLPHFDPHPYSLLGTLVAMEGIVLASFILMRQSRLGRRSDERDHLMLQILMLTEKELTALLKMDRQIAKQVGLEKMANSSELRELSEHISIDDVAQTIAENIPSPEQS